MKIKERSKSNIILPMIWSELWKLWVYTKTILQMSDLHDSPILPLLPFNKKMDLRDSNNESLNIMIKLFYVRIKRGQGLRKSETEEKSAFFMDSIHRMRCLIVPAKQL